MPNRVVIDRKVLDGFKRRALKAYPKETICGLYGRIHGSTVNLYAICPLKINKASSTSIEYEPPCEEEVEGEKYQYVGSIHTQPNADTVPSDTDWHSYNNTPDNCADEIIMGIASVTKKRGRRFTSFAFYDHESQLELVIAE